MSALDHDTSDPSDPPVLDDYRPGALPRPRPADALTPGERAVATHTEVTLLRRQVERADRDHHQRLLFLERIAIATFVLEAVQTGAQGIDLAAIFGRFLW